MAQSWGLKLGIFPFYANTMKMQLAILGCKSDPLVKEASATSVVLGGTEQGGGG